MRSRRYKQHHVADSLIIHKSGDHILCEYTFKGPYKPLEFYKLKNFHWWHSVNRWINSQNNKPRKIRCVEKYDFNNLNHDY